MNKKSSLFFLPIMLFLLLSAVAPGQEAYRRMSVEPGPFSGLKGETIDPATLKEISIGLFSPAPEKHAAAREVFQGVQLAVEEANAAGGYRNVPFAVKRRWADNPWAAGSKEVVKMVYQDRVWAIIAFREGGSHVALQIATKAFIPVIAPVSTAPSLTRSGVPWIFRLPPDDKQLARQLVRDGMLARSIQPVGIISGTDHDSRSAAVEMEKQMNLQKTGPVFHLKVSPSVVGLRDIVARARGFKPGGVVLCLPPETVSRVLRELGTVEPAPPVLLPWIPGVNIEELQKFYKGSLYMAEPYSIESLGKLKSAYRAFCLFYKKRFGEKPGFSAAYAYDAARMVITSIRRKGLNRVEIRRGLVELSHKQTAIHGPQGPEGHK